MGSRVDADVIDPRSRHNVHVTGPEDLQDTGEWSSETLYAAVIRADGDDLVVVLDYGRTALYLATGPDLTYEPPRVLGFAAPPALHVADPALFDPETGTAESVEPVVVTPAFDILVPAFDWEEMDEGDVLPPVHTARSATGSETGTPG